jgi:hypothetical protein
MIVTGEEVKTTCRELLRLKLWGQFCRAMNINYNNFNNEADLDKEIIIKEDTWQRMGL